MSDHTHDSNKQKFTADGLEDETGLDVLRNALNMIYYMAVKLPPDYTNGAAHTAMFHYRECVHSLNEALFSAAAGHPQETIDMHTEYAQRHMTALFKFEYGENGEDW